MSKTPSGDFNAQVKPSTNDNLPQWDLTKIYPSFDSPEFKADLEKAKTLIDNFSTKYEGKIVAKNDKGENIMVCDGQTLVQALKDDEEIDQALGRLFTYVSLKTVQRKDLYQAEQIKFGNDFAPIGTKMTFFSHAIMDLPESPLKEAINDTPDLQHYAAVIEKARKGIPHKLPIEVSKYAAEISPFKDWMEAYDEELVDMRFKFEGNDLTMDEVLEIFVSDPDRSRRAAAHQVFQDGMKANAHFFRRVHNAMIRQKSVSDRWKNFENPQDARHISNGINPAAVDALEKAVREGYQHTSHRFYTLKAKLMGLDTLAPYDRNANPFDGVQEKVYSWQEAKDIVLGAYRDFSPEFADIAQMFFDKGWIDAVTHPQKAGGAFAHPGMAHTDHPFVMVNFRGRARDVSTLAHELGHGVHQYLEAQNKAVLHAPLTFAETASVFGEMVTFKRLLADADTEDQKRKLMFDKANDGINTAMRQISFYVFEKKNYELFAKENRPLSTEEYAQHFREALQESYGDVLPLEEDYGFIFGYIPHLVHSPFYVYAYAFGEFLVNSLYENYENEPDKNAFIDKYFDMLKAGGTYTDDKLKTDFALDINDPEFWKSGMEMLAKNIQMLEEACAPILTAKAEARIKDQRPQLSGEEPA